MRKAVGLCLLCSIFLLFPWGAMASADDASAKPFPAVLPVPGTVTMIDLGAHSCIPCKMMAPIMEKVEKKYKGRAAIVFIDVWEYPQEPQKYGIRAIPTQIFYDHTGKEVYRHEGYYPEENIVHILDKLLADQGGK
jgi:thioredoxin 1